MRGRHPKPQALKDLAGNPGKRPRRKPATEAAVPGDAFAAPRSLTPRAAVVWKREMPRLRELNLVRPTDLAAVTVYCETFARWETAKSVLDEHGLTYATDTGYIRVRPEVGIVERCERSIRQFMESLGMTSASRIRTTAQLVGRQLPLPGFEQPSAAPPSADHQESPIGYLQ